MTWVGATVECSGMGSQAASGGKGAHHCGGARPVHDRMESATGQTPDHIKSPLVPSLALYGRLKGGFRRGNLARGRDPPSGTESVTIGCICALLLRPISAEEKWGGGLGAAAFVLLLGRMKALSVGLVLCAGLAFASRGSVDLGDSVPELDLEIVHPVIDCFDDFRGRPVLVASFAHW